MAVELSGGINRVAFKTKVPKFDQNYVALAGEQMRREFGPYKDDIGLFHNCLTAGAGGVEPQGSYGCGNALLYTSHVALAYKINGIHSFNVWREFYDQAMMGVRKCRIAPGLYRRHPVHYSRDQESFDDYVGICTLASFGYAQVAEDIVKRGQTPHLVHFHYKFKIPFTKKHIEFDYDGSMRWYFPNDPLFDVNFNIHAWLGRFIPFIAHAKACANLEVPAWQRFIWGVAIATAGLRNPKRNDVWIIPWNMINANRVFTPMEEWFIKIYKRRLTKYWGKEPMNAVFAAYFAKEHPLNRWADPQ